MKVILFNPPSPYIPQEGVQVVPPLGLLSIGALLEKAGHGVKIVDCVAHGWRQPRKTEDKSGKVKYRLDVEDTYLERLLTEMKPGIVGIGNLFATSESSALELARRIKRMAPWVKIVMGGTNATVRHDFLMQHPEVDFVVLGEGEYALRDLIACLEQGGDFSGLTGLAYRSEDQVRVTPGINWVEDLDDLPVSAYHLLDNSVEEYFHGHFGGFFVNKRILTMSTSRGCVLNCVFCSGKKHLGPWRARSPERVVDEIEHQMRAFDVREIAFVDSNINLDKKRFLRIMELMEERNLRINWTPFGGIFVKTFTPDLIEPMKRTGCHSICLAVEHGDPAMQEYIGKKVPLDKVQAILAECKKHGLWTHGYFVMGLPGETEQTMQQSFNYAKSADFDSVSFFVGTPLPGSRFYEQVKDHITFDSENLRFGTSDITWSHMDADRLNQTIKQFMMTFLLIKIVRQLQPYNFMLRIRSLNKCNIRLYKKIGERFLTNFFRR